MENNDLSEILDFISTCPEEEACATFMADYFLDHFDVDGFSFIDKPFVRLKRRIINNKYTDVSEYWRRSVDEAPPVSKIVTTPEAHHTGFTWGTNFGDEISHNVDYRNFIDGCADVGYRSNFSILLPDHDGEVSVANLLGVNGNKKLKFYHNPLLFSKSLLIVNCFSEKFINIAGPVTKKSAPPPLSAREIEALQWVANGYRPARIAEKMRISDWTVREYLASATQKLNSATLHQAVARAVARSIIRIY